jgi:hypothetical protein
MPEPAKPSQELVNKVFGDALPETTADEREPDSRENGSLHDRWLRDNIPPHHD